MMTDMNFFVPYQGQKKEEKNKNIYVYSIAGFLSVAIVGTFAWNTTNLLILNSKIKSYNSKLEKTEVKEKLEKWNEISKKNDILTKYNTGLNEIIGALETRQVVTTGVLNKLSSCLPSEVAFNNINIDNKEINIKAVSTNRVAIGEVEHNLKMLNNIQDVYIGGISGDEEFTFDIKCSLKDVN